MHCSLSPCLPHGILNCTAICFVRPLDIFLTARLCLLVALQGKSQRTTPQEGPAPFWNETKEVPFVPTGPSFEAQSLKENADIVTFSVFDEVIDVEHVRIIYTSPSGE